MDPLHAVELFLLGMVFKVEVRLKYITVLPFCCCFFSFVDVNVFFWIQHFYPDETKHVYSSSYYIVGIGSRVNFYLTTFT